MNKRLKTTIMVLATCMGVLFAVFSLLSIHSADKALRKAITEKTTNETVKNANQMSTILANAEGTVNALAASAENTFNMERYHADPQYVDQYIEMFDPILKNALADLNNTVGLFFTFDVNLVNQQEGYEIWYVYDETGQISFLDAAENGIYLEAFTDYDAEYMQYYFQAIRKPEQIVWTGPIYDPDINQKILTCSKSVFVNDTFIGVIGVDLNTKNTTDMIMAMDLESDGDIALFNQNGQAIVDSFDSSDRNLRASLARLLSDAGSQIRSTPFGSVREITDSQKHLLTYAHLNNGWILTVSNIEDVIFAPVTLISVLIAVLSVLLVIVLMGLLYIVLKKYNTPFEEALHLLKIIELESNITPEERKEIENEDDIRMLVKKQIQSQRNKDIMIAHQSRLAQTGKIMTSIAHQWKQPLNTINLVLGNLQDDYLHGEMTGETLGESIAKTQYLTRFMSETIDDFNRYLKPEDAPSSFCVDSVISSAAALLTDVMKKHKIRFSFDKKEDLKAYGYPNSFYHVVLNVLNNAVDASYLIDSEKRFISVASSQQDDKIIIKIFNCGNPLSPSVRDHLFTPYFTTKGSCGTGLGLSISRQILERPMGGSIILDNADGGVQCTITIPKGEPQL